MVSLSTASIPLFAYRCVQYAESTIQVCVKNKLDLGCTRLALFLFVIVRCVHKNMGEYTLKTQTAFMHADSQLLLTAWI